MRKFIRIVFEFIFGRRGKNLTFSTDNESRYWQITIIAKDNETNPESGGYLNSALIEQGIRLNRLPLFLEVSDVEAIEIGDKPITINPLPENLSHDN